MNILCSTDDNFVQHASAMLASLFENNKGQKIFVHVLTESLQEKNKADLNALAARYGAEIAFYIIGPEKLKGFPLKDDDYVSVAAYFRLLAPDVLPADVHKIIYLDGDVIVRQSLNELWSMDIDDYALSAIDETIADNCHRHCYDLSYGYFNSGVMLINLAYWRKNEVASRAISYMAEHPDRIKFWDQDALNGILYRNEWIRMPLKWNLTTLFLSRNFTNHASYSKVYATEYVDAVNRPAVVHYTGPLKPWNYVSSDHPYKNDYYKYLALTSWKDFKPRKTMSVALKRTAKKICLFLGLYTSPFVVLEKRKNH